MKQSFFIPGRLPSMNEIIALSHSQWRGQYNKIKKVNEEHIALAVKKAKIAHFDRVFLSFKWIEMNRKRDLDNIAGGGRKFILDTLVRCGIIDNDNWKYVAGWKDDFEIDKENPGILVTIEESNAQQEEGVNV